MPTNLPPDYYTIEEEYRQATTPEEKLALLEEMFSIIPKHKGTDHLRADLRRKMAKLKEQSQSRKGGGKHESVFHIEREGAGQIAVVGVANVGKSALVAALTNATPEVAPYPYTTWVATPGMMPIEDVQVQLVDTPPLNPDHVENELLNLIRNVDLLWIVIDLQAYPIAQLEKAVDFLAEHRIIPAHRSHTYEGERRATFLPTFVIVNKNDDEGSDEDFLVLEELLGDEWRLFPVSATTGRGFDRLKKAVFQELGIIRIYCKPPGKDPDMEVPFVIKTGGTVVDFAGKVHRDFIESLKSARIWGQGVHDGQMVSRDHVLHDGDIVELKT